MIYYLYSLLDCNGSLSTKKEKVFSGHLPRKQICGGKASHQIKWSRCSSSLALKQDLEYPRICSRATTSVCAAKESLTMHANMTTRRPELSRHTHAMAAFIFPLQVRATDVDSTERLAFPTRIPYPSISSPNVILSKAYNDWPSWLIRSY